MTTENFKKFISDLESVGMTHYEVRCAGGNRTIYNNPDFDPSDPSSDPIGIISIDGDELISTEISRLSIKPDRCVTISRMTIESCDEIILNDIPVDYAKKFLQAQGVWNKEYEKFFSEIPRKMDIWVKDNNAGLSVMKDENGNDMLPIHSTGMITYGKPRKK